MPLTPEQKRERRKREADERAAAHAAAGTVAQKRGRPPTGKRWDDHLGHWVADDAAPAPAEESLTPVKKRPAGRAPKGTTWSGADGAWVDDGSGDTRQTREERAAKKQRRDATHHQRDLQWSMLNDMEDTLRRSPPDLMSGTDEDRQWRCRDDPMMRAVLQWERDHAADGSPEWWLAACRIARAAQTKHQDLHEALNIGGADPHRCTFRGDLYDDALRNVMREQPLLPKRRSLSLQSSSPFVPQSRTRAKWGSYAWRDTIGSIETPLLRVWTRVVQGVILDARERVQAIKFERERGVVMERKGAEQDLEFLGVANMYLEVELENRERDVRYWFSTVS